MSVLSLRLQTRWQAYAIDGIGHSDVLGMSKPADEKTEDYPTDYDLALMDHRHRAVDDG